MNQSSSVDGLAQGLLRMVLPPRCLLCGADGAGSSDLCDGCRGDVAANEPCCARCALPLAIAASSCGECLRRAPPFATAWAPLRYAHPLDLLEARFKFRADLAAGRVLSELLIAHAMQHAPMLPDAIVPIPLHATRLRERGYNQALELVRPLASHLRVPLREDLLLRPKATPAQTGLDASARRRNVRGAFASLSTSNDMPAHVAVFDDVMTTGATMREATRTLLRAGVKRVDVWALARAPTRRH